MELPERIRALLDENRTMVIATVAPDGQPEAASVFYAPVHDGSDLFLVSALLATSAKLGHLCTASRTGVFIGPRAPTRWLQATATARIVVDEDERRERLALLLAHAPEAAIFVERMPVAAVLFRVERVKLTDLTGGQPPIQILNFEQRA